MSKIFVKSWWLTLGCLLLSGCATTPNSDSYSSPNPEQDPPKWDRTLPFMAKKAVESGHKLPNPIGVSIIYAETKQRMSLTELEAGFSFWDKGLVPMEFVTFDGNYSHSKSPQLKIDAWLFPFMNVFATVGKVNGDAHVEFDLDGNGILEHMDKDCSGRITSPTCRLLSDKSLHVPVDVDLNGYNYTLGMVLAGGWDEYFVTMPASVTYIDMKKADAEELVINLSPRIGRTFSMNDGQSMNLFVGASYLDSDLRVRGTQKLPDTDEVIEYRIRQENIDKWAALAGANFNFNREWSLSMEYAQNSHRKRQFISNLNYRY